MENRENMKTFLQKETYDFYDLVYIMELLRDKDGGCPWDIEQTHESIRNNFIEETYEVIEAIDTNNKKLLREELGDVMLQIVFHARMEEEAGTFNIDDVSNDICEKLIRRHPHIFSDTKADTVDQVLSNWDKIKSEEKARKTLTQKLQSIPAMLPALMRAEKVGDKAHAFDFPDTESVMTKIEEEWDEVKDAIEAGEQKAIEEEIGDLLLSVTSLCRKLGVSAEQALNAATDKFIARFAAVEAELNRRHMDMENTSPDVLDGIWNEIKKTKA